MEIHNAGKTTDIVYEYEEISIITYEINLNMRVYNVIDDSDRLFFY